MQSDAHVWQKLRWQNNPHTDSFRLFMGHIPAVGLLFSNEGPKYEVDNGILVMWRSYWE